MIEVKLRQLMFVKKKKKRQIPQVFYRFVSFKKLCVVYRKSSNKVFLSSTVTIPQCVSQIKGIYELGWW